MTMEKITPKQGQESVWDYPRPPRLEHCETSIKVLFGGEVIAEATRCYRVLETSHPPTYYLPPEAIKPGVLVRSKRWTHCEWKGQSGYYHVRVGEEVAENAAWFYPNPTEGFSPLAGWVAFYPGRMEACYVDGEKVQVQPGDFYGGWITSKVVGPFKGAPGTWNW